MHDATHHPVAEIGLSSWRERGAVVTGGVEYTVSRQGLTGPFILAGQGMEVARAVKPSVFKHEPLINHGGREYTLKRASAWRREYNLLLGDQKLGSVAAEAWFSSAVEPSWSFPTTCQSCSVGSSRGLRSCCGSAMPTVEAGSHRLKHPSGRGSTIGEQTMPGNIGRYAALIIGGSHSWFSR